VTLRQCESNKISLYTLIALISFVYTSLYENTITSYLIVPFKYVKLQNPEVVVKTGYKLMFATSLYRLDSEYWLSQDYLWKGLGMTEETKDRLRQVIVPVLPALNKTYFDREFFTHYFGYRKHAQLLTGSIAEANLHADRIEQAMLNSYSCHTTQECLPGINFFTRFRVKATFTYEALDYIRQFQAGGFTNLWNSTEFYINKLKDRQSRSKTREEFEYFQSTDLLTLVSLLPVFVVWFSGLIISGLTLAQEVFIDVYSTICSHNRVIPLHS